MSDITSHSAAQLAHLIRHRDVSVLEVIEAFIARIERINPLLNSIVTLAPDLLEQAQAADALLSGSPLLGPLHGVPLTIKDTIDTAGLRTTSGSLLRAHHVPESDAPAVARLKAAGAIILGKTNTAELAMDYNADNPVFGRTNNPYDSSRSPGGSSGGEAAAIAACMSAGGLGSDLAGSIRIPAHFCGIAGLKPGVGRVPGAGQFPPSAGPYSLGAAIGPLARQIADLQLIFGVISDPMPVPASGSRVAWYADDGVTPITLETRRAVRAAALALADAGFAVEECRPPGVEQALDMWLKIFSRASVVLLRDVYQAHEDQAGPFVSWRLRTADDSPAPGIDDYIHAWLERDQLRSELLKWMEHNSLLVAPVGATPAIEHDAHKVWVDGTAIGTFRAFSYCQAFNVFDLPALTLPVARSAEGLPIGVQIVGRPGAEERVMAAALIVEEALGGWPPPPLSDKL